MHIYILLKCQKRQEGDLLLGCKLEGKVKRESHLFEIIAIHVNKNIT